MVTASRPAANLKSHQDLESNFPPRWSKTSMPKRARPEWHLIRTCRVRPCHGSHRSRSAGTGNGCGWPADAIHGDGLFPTARIQGWLAKLDDQDSIRRTAGMDPDKLARLREWLRESDERPFAAVVIRRGFKVLEEERGNSSISNTRRVASCSKAVCATVLAIASEQSQHGQRNHAQKEKGGHSALRPLRLVLFVPPFHSSRVVASY